MNSVVFFELFMQQKKGTPELPKNQSMQIINWQNNPPPSRQIYVQWCYKIKSYIYSKLTSKLLKKS